MHGAPDRQHQIQELETRVSAIEKVIGAGDSDISDDDPAYKAANQAMRTVGNMQRVHEVVAQAIKELYEPEMERLREENARLKGERP